MKRSIFHIRLRNFEVQAERLVDKQLRTRAVAIISSASQNGTVVQLSKEAKSEGLAVGMKVSVVRRMTHSVQLLHYNNRLYNAINQHVFKTVSLFTPVIEPEHYGQFYLDMTGMNRLYKNNRQAGSTMLNNIHNKVDIDCSVGISSNKLVSRTSTLTVPEPLYEIQSGSEPCFMAPLSSGLLPVVKEKPVAKLVNFLFLKQVLDIQTVLTETESAAVLFGKFHGALEMQAYGKDLSAVSPPQRKPHILKHKILNSTTNNREILEAAVQNLAMQLGYDLRLQNKLPKSLTLEIHYADGFTGFGKGRPIANDDKSLTETCLQLFRKANHRRNRIRSILLDAADFVPVTPQLDLFQTPEKNELKLSQAVDAIRCRFGALSIQPAVALAC